MAKVKFKFIDKYWSERTFEVYQVPNSKEEICIRFFDEDDGIELPMIMDIPTAIKFAKTLRTEINKAKEVYNV